MIVARGSGVVCCEGHSARQFKLGRWLTLRNRVERREGAHGMERSAATPPATRGAATDDAFAAFVAAHEAPLFAYLWRSTGDEHAAYDLRQETFIRAWRHFAQVRDYERPLAWLYHVATNLALNYRRDQRPAAPPLKEDDLASSDPAWRLAERDLIHETLLKLPARERQALALRSGQGLSCEEVATALDISAAAARVLLFRAREHFRALYQAANADHGGQGDAQ